MSKVNRAVMIGVIGPSELLCTKEVYDFGLKLGKMLVDNDYFVVCGGLGGVMEAVCKGAYDSDKYYKGKTIGVIPSADKKDANKYCDIIIPTGLGFARNTIVVNSADVVIAIGGGSGTLSEIAFAWQMHRPIICYDGFDGWASELAGKKLDIRRKDVMHRVSSIDEIRAKIASLLV